MKLNKIMLSLVTALTAATPAAVLADDFQTISEMSLFKQDITHGSYPGEQINPNTGKVSWVVTDLTVPGPNGLDIKINRKFDYKSGFGGYDNSYFGQDYRKLENNIDHIGPYSWKLDLPNIYIYDEYKLPAPFPPEIRNDTCGIMFKMFSVYSPASGNLTPVNRDNDNSLYPNNVIAVYENNWQLTCENKTTSAKIKDKDGNSSDIVSPMVLVSPEGTKYRFFKADDILTSYTASGENHTQFKNYYQYKLAEVEDTFGNTISYNYSKLDTVTGSGFVSHPHILDTISGSDGRLVTFNYETPTSTDPRPEVTSITGHGKTVKYTHNSERLTKVELPNGDSWEYDYYDAGNTYGEYGLLKQVKVPTGAKFDYTYTSASASDECHWKNPCFSVRHQRGQTEKIYQKISVKTKTISGDEIETRSESYAYKYDKTQATITITTPTRKLVNIYSRAEHSENWQDSLKDEYQLANRLKSYKIQKLDGTDVRTTDYEYEIVKKTGEKFDDFLSAFIPRYVIRQTKATITEDGQTYVTANSNFDKYDRPQTVVETGNDGQRTTNFTYHNDVGNWIIGKTATKTVVGGGTKSYEYGSKGEMTSETEFGIQTKYTYDTAGNMTSNKWQKENAQNVKEWVGHTYSNFKRGKHQTEITPTKVTLNRNINELGQIVWEKDGKGKQTSFTYDDLGRISSITPPSGSMTSVTWNSPTTQTVTRGNKKVVSQFDALGREIKSTMADTGSSSAQKIVKTKSYDIEGRVNFESFKHYSNDTAYGTKSTYDELDRVLKKENTADNTITVYCYTQSCLPNNYEFPASANKVKVITDARGYHTVSTHRAYGDPDNSVALDTYHQVLKVGEQNATQAKYMHTDIERNVMGLLTSVKQGGKTRTVGYNENNRPITYTDPETGLTTLKYDTAGNVIYRKVGNATAQLSTFDEANRIKSVDNEGTAHDATKNYDANGNPVSVTVGSITWDYAYTDRNILDHEILTIEGNTHKLDYTVDDLDNVASVTYPNGEKVEFAPDALGRPTKVGQYIYSIEYNAKNQVKSLTNANGTKYVMTLDKQNRPETISLKKGYTNMVKRTYKYDDNANVTQIQDNVNPLFNQTMAYDGLNRLITANGKWGSGTITYDDGNNITRKTIGTDDLVYSYDSQNRLNKVTNGNKVYQYGYDAMGNVTAKNASYTSGGDIADESRSFNYDNAGHLINSGSMSFLYDGNGKRVVSKKNNVVKEYSMYSNAEKLMFKNDVEKGKTTNYIYLNGMLVIKKSTISE